MSKLEKVFGKLSLKELKVYSLYWFEVRCGEEVNLNKSREDLLDALLQDLVWSEISVSDLIITLGVLEDEEIISLFEERVGVK